MMCSIIRLETQRLVIEPENFAVCELLSSLCKEVGPAAASGGNTLRYACEYGLTCRADAAVIERCLRQLISNAMKFTVQGEIVLCAYREADQLVIDVCDTGVGIEEDVLVDLFVAFRKRPDECGGAGLGLALTRRLAEALGGEVTAESTPGVGSTFSLRAPVAFEARAAA
jgi:signal transduction histidine kinase